MNKLEERRKIIHEMKSPLTAIIGYISLIDTHAQDTEYLSKIVTWEQNTQRDLKILQGLIQELIKLDDTK